MASRVLGLIRDQVLASMFGAGNAMDAFNVAFRIPNLVRDLFAEGAMSAAFVPVFMRQLASGDRAAAWRLGNNVINALLVVTGIVVFTGIVSISLIADSFLLLRLRAHSATDLSCSSPRAVNASNPEAFFL